MTQFDSKGRLVKVDLIAFTMLAILSQLRNSIKKKTRYSIDCSDKISLEILIRGHDMVPNKLNMHENICFSWRQNNLTSSHLKAQKNAHAHYKDYC